MDNYATCTALTAPQDRDLATGTQARTLAAFPDEILKQIMSSSLPDLNIPASLIDPDDVADAADETNTRYRDWMRCMLLLGRGFSRCAPEAFFAAYTHDVYMLYDCPTYRGQDYVAYNTGVRHLLIGTARGRIQRMTLRIEGTSLADGQMAIKDLLAYLQTYPGLREVEVTLTLAGEHWFNFDKLEPQVWDELMKWRTGAKLRRDVELVMGCQGDHESPDGYRRSREVRGGGEVISTPWSPFGEKRADEAGSGDDDDDGSVCGFDYEPGGWADESVPSCTDPW